MVGKKRETSRKKPLELGKSPPFVERCRTTPSNPKTLVY